jgi:hypothetical protein
VCSNGLEYPNIVLSSLVRGNAAFWARRLLKQSGPGIAAAEAENVRVSKAPSVFAVAEHKDGEGCKKNVEERDAEADHGRRRHRGEQ